MKSLCRWLGAGVLAGGLVAAAWPAAAAEWPMRALHFITTSAAGSPLDSMMRALGKELGEILGQTVVVENRPGGTGAVGMNMALNAPADGYTVVSATGSTSFLMAEKDSRFQPSDFVFLRALQTEPSSVAVRKDSPYRTLKDLVEALKANPQKVNIGGFATAGFHQYVLYRLEQKAGFKATWVPYQGGNQALLALMGGHLDAAVITPSTAMAQIRSGDVRLLGISSEKRSAFFPEVPTFREQGYDVVETLWRGVMVVKGTPPEATRRLVQALEAVEKRSSWQAFMRENLQDDLPLSQPDLQRFVEKEVADRRQFLASLQK
ncbi:MAG: tripartite tricarboxylate transporter substrate binding protein [Pigmentiphaga sp.]|uniref:tripartite tricarboxylate transporter substrate binding protein n=1 Tax=Pigmentiphaga sp. TaxID=1977564 RepID=UPI0029BDF35B|nr:tripartite tricarboxylate transporter substrate binding protein [Pigmentiphaga sp.]MDX3905272.1 tripartite tricarboxylate transporter substrate binding protein [Pigmentiphaga sp.]